MVGSFYLHFINNTGPGSIGLIEIISHQVNVIMIVYEYRTCGLIDNLYFLRLNFITMDFLNTKVKN